MNLEQTLNRATANILRALVRVLLRHGVSLQSFVELAKRAYVQTAMEDFSISGRKPTASRVSVLTGLTRKEVQRLLAVAAAEPWQIPPSHNRASRVIAGWVRDAAFHGTDGQPAALEFDGPEASFAALVRRYGGDVTPRAVLDELVRVGAVARDANGRVRLMSRVYLPRTGDVQKLFIFGTDVPYLIETIDHNLQNPQQPRFQRKVMYDNLPLEVMPEFHAFAAEESQRLIERLDAWLARHDRDSNPSVAGTGRMRAGVGIFHFEERLDDPRSAS